MRHWSTWFVALAMFGVCLSACNGESTAYTEACTADTPEAYQQYMEQYPDGLHVADVRHRLDLADYEIAEKAKTTAAYEKYLEDHPEGKYADKAMDRAKNLAWEEAEKVNTVEAMVAFKEKYGAGAFGLKADTRLAALRYALTSVQFADVVVERIHVGGDRRAEPNGYAIRTTATNSGEKACKVMKVRVVFLDASSNIAEIKMEFLATPSHPMGIPIPERLKLPFTSGQARAFEYLVGDPNVNEDWVADAEHTRVEVVEIEFVEG